jgi:hypothetical protein
MAPLATPRVSLLGVPVTCSDIFGTAGSAWLDGLRLSQPNAGKITSLRQLRLERRCEPAVLNTVCYMIAEYIFVYRKQAAPSAGSSQ